LLRALAGVDFILPYYHVVSDHEIPHVRHLYRYKSVRDFKADLDFILAHYSPIDLSELLNHVQSGRRLPEKAFLLTFDDGFREMSEIVAPILTEKGVSATFFVNSAFIDNAKMCYLNKASLLVEELQRRQSVALREDVARALRAQGVQSDDVVAGILSITYRKRALVDHLAEIVGLDFDEYLSVTQPYLTAAQIRTLIRDGFTIGAHSVDHPLYASLSLDEQISQTVDSLNAVRRTFGLSYGAFAFPHSDTNVSREFFDKLSATGLLDVSFGTAGLIHDSVPAHFQRFSLEAPLEEAQRILAFQLVRRLRKNITGSATIAR
jgi:peptidoglycan/xylan/chitin deacetylase (PgdA/CDA1 family)